MKIISICLLVFLCSCNLKRSSGDLNYLIDREIVFNNDSLLRYVGPEYTLISYVDSGECTPCSLNKVQIYQRNKDELEELGINVILLVKNTDKELVHAILKDMHIQFPVFFDENGFFKTKNELPNDVNFQDLIIDKDYRVIWLGSPFFDKNSWEKFKQMIRIKENVEALRKKN